MPKKTDKLRSYVEAARDLDRDLRKVLVEVLQEEEVLSRVNSANTNDLKRKYNMERTGS